MRIFLNALENQVVPDSEMISLNYLLDNVPLNAKFTFNQTVHELQVQTKHKLKHRHSALVVSNCNLPKMVEPATWQTKEIPNEAK